MQKNLSVGAIIDDYWKETPKKFYRKDFLDKFLGDRENLVIQMLEVKKGIKIADIGCGNGSIIKYLKDVNITFVDYSDKMLELCRENVGEGYRIIKAEATDLSLPDEEFDITIALGLIDYIKDYRKAISELHRITKPGGQIIFTAPKKYTPFFFMRIWWLRKKVFDLPPLLTILSKKELFYLLSETNLKPIKISSLYGTMWIVRCKKAEIGTK